MTTLPPVDSRSPWSQAAAPRVRGKGIALLVALAATTLAGCISGPVRIEYEVGDHLVTSTGERLYRVRASEVGALYLKPGVDFARYETVAFRSASVSYAEPPRSFDTLARTRGNFLLRPDAVEGLQRELGERLRAELSRDEEFRVVPEPIPGTLVISPHIVNLRWENPPTQGSESLFVRQTGSMTLVADLRDAETGALLARIADARAIKPLDVGPQGAFESTPANNWAGVRDVCTRWGWLLRETLVSLRELPPMPSP